ncbi:acyltransferase family protein [Cryobacterium levicorallinum]|nr:acyltransferase family protein [Cryobacterium levicorallinum]SFH88929.1 Peptidoglycan/LPS O-acetylase OafA/YrhL, contains acyltransferase and SGNH-hydrolase domains [Cryobacterium levicorallinum]
MMSPDITFQLSPVATVPNKPRSPRRRDIQGLRAIAVILVVVYHYFPGLLSGGFIGVDVFFVISGFLITLLLFKEIQRSGRISLSGFYARRIRRLLPAATVTLVGTVLAAFLLVGPIRLAGILQDMAWTAGYLANYHFSQATTGYFDTSDPSPFLHFWSLAVEEQYYLLWPLVLIAVLPLARERAWIFMVVLIAIIACSLSASVILTNAEALGAYYSLATRAWELAIGGGLAYLVFHRRFVISGRIRSGVSWAGILAIAGSAAFYTDATPFPGWTAAVPALGAALVLWAGSYGEAGTVYRLLSLRPAQFIGNISYSLYLWHWPVLILGAAYLGGEPGRAKLLILGMVAILLASASYFVVEQPLNRVRAGFGPFRVIALGLGITLLASLTPLFVSTLIVQSSGEIVAQESESDVILSSATSPITFAIQGPGPTPDGVPANLQVALDDLDDDLAEVFTNGCYGPKVNVCEGGDPEGTLKIVLAGDSHAGQWWPAVDRAARDNNWKLYIVGKNGCALADVEISQGTTSDAWPECASWQEAAPGAILALDPDLIVYANHAQGYRTSKVSLKDGFIEKWTDGVSTTLHQMTGGSTVLFIGQTPTLLQDPATCLSENILDVSACSTPTEKAVPQDLLDLNESVAVKQQVSYFDPTQLLCSEGVCPVVAANVIMYRDIVHLSATYSAQLSPKIAEVITAALGERP